MRNSTKIKNDDDEMRAEYDFSDSMPNKYAARLRMQKRLVSIDPDVYKIFKTDEQVNNALRAIIAAYPKRRNVQAEVNS